MSRSRFDYADPGQDARYCDGLSVAPEPEPEPEILREDTPLPTDEDIASAPTCYYCGAPSVDIYCSALCACWASYDNSFDGRF